MSDSRNDWKDELHRSPSCIAIERLGEQLTTSEREHLANCPRCQAEMALFTEFAEGETSATEASDVQWIVDRLHKRNVVSIGSRRRIVQPRYLAIAATLLIAIAIGYVVENREPSIERPVARDLYRSARVDVIGPVGDVAAPPRELQWKPVEGADEYRVVVSEVDRTIVWQVTTRDTRVALPDSVVRQLVPGKTIVWEVTVTRAGSAIQSSGTQRFRVATQPVGSHS